MNNDLISREGLKKIAREKLGDDITSITMLKVFDEIVDDAPTIPLRLMTVEECAGHTIDYAMGWKACIEWIKKGGEE